MVVNRREQQPSYPSTPKECSSLMLYLLFAVLLDVHLVQLLRRFSHRVVRCTRGFHDLLSNVRLVVCDCTNKVDVLRGEGLDRQGVEPDDVRKRDTRIRSDWLGSVTGVV